MHRREFLLDGCKACAALLALPALTSLEGCASSRSIAFTEEGSLIAIPVSAFADRTTAVLRPKSLMDPVLVVKGSSGNYRAFQMKCTHKGQPVALAGEAIVCDAHGSRFDLEGRVTKGPAKAGLKEYPVTTEDGVLRVDLKG
jgi:nitrite reductase/ring-hydroxylating ferredoxin subunit